MARGSAHDVGESHDQAVLDIDVEHGERDESVAASSWIRWKHGPANGWAWAIAIGFIGLCGLLVLRTATGRPDWVVGWRITLAFLLFAGVLFVGRYVAGDRTREPRWLVPLRIGLLVFLLSVVAQSSSPGVGPGFGPLPDRILILYALVGLVVVADDPRSYSPAQWIIIGCFAIFAAIYVHHSVGVSPTSPLSRHPVWGATLLGLWLVVLPRYLPPGLVFWAFSRVAAVLTVLGLAVYGWGPYDLAGLEFGFHGTYTVPVIEYEVRAIRSFFVNRNSFAIVAFAGFVSALVEYFRGVRDGRSAGWMLVPSTFVIVNGVGFFLAYGRGLWVIGIIPLLVYFAYLDFGRRSIPVSAVLATAYLVGGVVVLYYAMTRGYTEGPESNRFNNWGPTIAAIRDNPSLFGEGLVNTREFIQPYRNGGSGPHNSYLSTWIRMGSIGVTAYVGMIAVGLLDGVRRYRTVDVGALALAMGFAAHQLFEGYTMFRWEFASAAAALSLGLVAFGAWRGTGGGGKEPVS